MSKKQKEISNGYKLIIWLTFIGVVICLAILISIINPEPKYKYRTEVITLNNTNMFEDWDVVDYLCDDNVEVSVHHFAGDAIYLSTWRGVGSSYTESNYGQCMLKIRELVK